MTEPAVFPLAPAPFRGESRKLDPGECFDWLLQGWTMFIANPGIWVICTVLLLVILTAVSVVPIFGQIAAHLLAPIFGAGMMQICQRLSNNKRSPEVTDLFAGFRHNPGPLVMVGVYFALGIFGLATIAFLLISAGILGSAITASIAGFGFALGGIMLAGLLVALLSVPVIMAVWFAPALVFFHEMSPSAAMWASFNAGMKNWLAMLIFGIFLLVALFFAMLPLGLGLLILLPVFSGAAYASYRSIFFGV